jgi:hypothetical protein
MTPILSSCCSILLQAGCRPCLVRPRSHIEIRNDMLTLELYASAEDAGRGLNEERHRIETAVVDDGRLSSE